MTGTSILITVMLLIIAVPATAGTIVNKDDTEHRYIIRTPRGDEGPFVIPPRTGQTGLCPDGCAILLGEDDRPMLMAPWDRFVIEAGRLKPVSAW